jgi:hypothetical protein
MQGFEMFKPLILRTCWVLLLVLMAGQVCQADQMSDALKQCVVTHASSSIKVDGDLGDWREVDWIGLMDPDTNQHARMSWQWDRKYLYLAVMVLDDSPYTTPADQSPRSMYRYDSLQLALDPKLNAIAGQSRMSDDLELGLGLIDGQAKTWVYFADKQVTRDSDGFASDVQLVIKPRTDAKGYIYEVAFPWSMLQVTPAPDLQMGADLLVNNGGEYGGIPHRRCFGWGHGIAHGKDPSAYRRLVLASPGHDWYASREKPEMTFKQPEFRYENPKNQTPDPDAHGGFAATSPQKDGIYTWWHLAGQQLKPGTYDAYVRLKGKGLFGLHATQNKVRQSMFTRKVDSPDKYSVFYLGRVVHEGDKSLRISDWSSRGLFVDWIGLVPLNSSEAVKDITPQIEALQQTLDRVTSEIKAASAAGLSHEQLAYPRTLLNVAGYFADMIPADIQLNKLGRARDHATYLVERLDQLSRQIKAWQADSSRASKFMVPTVDPDAPLTFKGTSFYRSGRPWIALGVCVGDAREVRPLGLLMQHSFEPMPRLLSKAYEYRITEAYRDRQDARLGLATQLGVITDFLPAIHYIPGYIKKEHPGALAEHEGFHGGFTYAPTYPKLRELLQPYYETILPFLAEHKTVKFICLGNEVALMDFSSYAQQAFHRWLQDRYKSIAQLNNTWQSDYASFGAIVITPKTKSKNAGAWYDFNIFSQVVLADFFQWLHGVSHQHNANAWTHIKIMSRAFQATQKEAGVDRQRLNNITDIVGVDGPIGGNFEAELDLIRSLSPGKPVYNSEYHIVGLYSSEAEIHGTCWNHAIHGQAAGALWHGNYTAEERLAVSKLGGHREADKASMYNPAAHMGFSRASLDFRRLGESIIPFWDQQPRVAIYYGRASKILGELSYLNQMLSVHLACRFAGIPVRFITDRQIADGGLKDCDLLIVANAQYVSDETVKAIAAYPDAHHKLVLIGDSLTHDQHARPRQVPTIGKAEHWAIGTAGEYHTKLIAHQPARRLLDANGKPTWGIEWRSVQQDGHDLLYIQNFMAKTQSVQLPFAGLELISHQPVGQRITVQPNVPYLIRQQ